MLSNYTLLASVVSPPSDLNGQFFYVCDGHCTYHNVIHASNFVCALPLAKMHSIQLVVYIERSHMSICSTYCYSRMEMEWKIRGILLEYSKYIGRKFASGIPEECCISFNAYHI